MPEPQSPYKRVRRNFRQKTLKRVCEMHETEFEDAYGLDKYIIQERQSDNFYLYQDNGSSILAVAHLDTVIDHARRTATFVKTEAGPLVFSGALDDRLGAYTILELLPSLGLQFDILLTVGEESGKSTAEFFDTPDGKEYNWMIEFDRMGTDVVMYQYDDTELRQLVRNSGSRPADGIFSDISYLEHLEIKGLNWGVGYRDYHGPRGHAWLNDYWDQIGHFMKFYEANKDTYLPHEKKKYVSSWGSRGRSSWSGQGGGSGYLWDTSDYGESNKPWWDAEEPEVDNLGEALRALGEDDEPWWENEKIWEDAHWDAYLAAGVAAVKLLSPPAGYEVLVELEDEGGEEEVDEEVESDDFVVVNRALTAGQPGRSLN